LPAEEDSEPVETADNIELTGPRPVDPIEVQRSVLPPVAPPRKLPVPGVPTSQETRPVSAEATKFRGRSKYRAWA